MYALGHTEMRYPAVPASTGDEALVQCTKPSGVPRGPSHLQFPWLLRATMRSPLRSPAQVEGNQGFLPQPGKDLERPSSTRLEARLHLFKFSIPENKSSWSNFIPESLANLGNPKRNFNSG